MAYNLKPAKQEAVIRCLVEGTSVRATERITGVHRDTVLRLMVRVGSGCEALRDEYVRNLSCERIQLDEIWGFVGKKQKQVKDEDDERRVGDFWTFVAIDAETKLVPSYLVGKRDGETAQAFVNDLASRLYHRTQLSTDGLKAYLKSIDEAFGHNVDYAQIVKFYEAVPPGAGRYSPPKVMRTRKTIIIGHPDPEHISTSYIERQNLTMRMSMRRLTRLTNAFSKKVENLVAAVSLHFGYYNFVRRHMTLKTAPAVAAGVLAEPWTMSEFVEMALQA